MLMWVLSILAGILLLARGADYFVESAASIAQKLGIHPMIVGVVVLGFATAIPEMIVSAIAAWHQQLGMSVGNAVGSSIANIGLVLGGTALVVPLRVCASTLRYEFPVVFLSMILITALIWDKVLSFNDGLIIVAGFFAMIVWLVMMAKKRVLAVKDSAHAVPQLQHKIATGRIIFCFSLGLMAMFFGSHLMVYGAKGIASYFGVSDFIIGLTIVAVGTSLPELAASIVAGFRGEHDIAIGNVLGSNLFNMLAVMAMPALIIPGEMPDALLARDIPIMFGFSFLMLVLMVRRSGDCQVTRFSGAVLLLSFLTYNAYLFLH